VIVSANNLYSVSSLSNSSHSLLSSNKSLSTAEASAIHDFAAASRTSALTNAIVNCTDDTNLHEMKPEEMVENMKEFKATMLAYAQEAIDNKEITEEEVLREAGITDGLSEPACSQTANIVTKLFTDKSDGTKSFSVMDVSQKGMNLAELKGSLEHLDKNKSYLIRVKDPRTSHHYVVHIPAQTTVEKKCFLYQSDLGYLATPGDGVTQQVTLAEWMDTRGKIEIPLRNVMNVWDGLQERTGNDTNLAYSIAEVFDKDQDSNNINVKNINFDAPAPSFLLIECPSGQLEINVRALAK
jgi:hypothetical protein